MKIANNIEERKKLQDIFFILKSSGALNGYQDDFKYKYYGPCCLIFEYEIDELILDGFLSEDKNGRLLINNSICFDINKDVYREKKLLDFLCANEYQYGALELVSIIFYLYENGYHDKTYIRNKLVITRPNLYWAIPVALALHHKIINGVY